MVSCRACCQSWLRAHCFWKSSPICGQAWGLHSIHEVPCPILPWSTQTPPRRWLWPSHVWARCWGHLAPARDAGRSITKTSVAVQSHLSKYMHTYRHAYIHKYIYIYVFKSRYLFLHTHIFFQINMYNYLYIYIYFYVLTTQVDISVGHIWLCMQLRHVQIVMEQRYCGQLH